MSVFRYYKNQLKNITNCMKLAKKRSGAISNK